jgi:hypothetical protein
VERGARIARRDDREYREYLREEQRSRDAPPARWSLISVDGPRGLGVLPHVRPMPLVRVEETFDDPDRMFELKHTTDSVRART